MKKTVLFILLIAALLLASCGTADTQSPTAAAAERPTAGADQVEIVWYVRANDMEQHWETEVVIPDFERRYPGIRVNLVVAPLAEFDTRMQIMIEAGSPPDVWSHWGSSGFQDYVKSNLVADLTPFIEKDRFNLSDFQEEVLNIYSADGKILGLPMMTAGTFVFYNKDLFDKAGVDYPPTDWDDSSWTWDAFLEKCEALTHVKGDPRTDVFGCNLSLWPEDQYAWMWGQDIYPETAYRTGFADSAFLDHPAVIQAFQARQDLVWKLRYMPDPAQVDAFGGGDLFANQKVAMHITGGLNRWQSPPSDFRWGAAALPYGGPGRKGVIFTDPWMLSSQSNHPEEAWIFLKYLVSSEVQESFMELSGAPPVRKSLAEKWYNRFPSMTAEEVKEAHLGALRHGRENPAHLLVRFGMLNQIVSSAFGPVLTNEKNASETLPAANEKLIKALKQIQFEFE